MTKILRSLPIAVLAICSVGATGEDAAAQSRIGVGYVVNAPNMFFGGSGHVLFDQFGGFGLYVDAKFDRSTPRDDQAPLLDITVQQVEDEFGDELLTEDEVWQSYNVALMRPITPELILYAGGGMAERESYRQYFDETNQRTSGGYYWVEDTEASGDDVNYMVGAMFRISPALFVQFGVESAPRGATIGGVYSLSLK